MSIRNGSAPVALLSEQAAFLRSLADTLDELAVDDAILTAMSWSPAGSSPDCFNAARARRLTDDALTQAGIVRDDLAYLTTILGGIS
jgi:hypothetical protein